MPDDIEQEQGMIRAPLRWLRQLCTAALVLVVLYCAAELGLRAYDSYDGQITQKDAFDRGITCKSWTVHHELKPSLDHQLPHPDTGEPVPFLTNRFGLRGPEISVPKPPGVYRIICLGDDQTLAAELPESDTFCSRLQILLQSRTQSRVEVINAGIPDSCPLLASLLFEHRLMGLQPDLVILNIDMSDIADDYRFRRYATIGADRGPVTCAHPGLQTRKTFSEGETQPLLLIPLWLKQQGSSLLAEQVLPTKSRDIDSPLGKYLWLQDQPPDWSVYIQQALSPLEHLRGLTAGIYADFIVASYPVPWQVSATASNGDGVRGANGVAAGDLFRSRLPFSLIGETCASLQIPFCDTSPQFDSAADANVLFLDNAPRFSAAGHALYAREVALFLVQQQRNVWQQPRQSGLPPGLSGLRLRR